MRFEEATMKIYPSVCRGLISAVAALMLATGDPTRAAAPDEVLQEARAASGGNEWDRVKSIAATGTEEKSGMVSTWRGVDDLESPRLMRLQAAGIVRHRHVWNGPRHWHQDSSGTVHEYDSEFARESSVTDVWLAQRGYLNADAAGATLSRAERRSDAGLRFDVLSAIPKNGRPVELWFDARNHLLARTVRQRNLNTETVTYRDYRAVEGVKLAHLITEDDGDGSPDIVRVSSYALNAATPADFETPQQPDDATIDGAETTVPIQFDGDVVVEAKINGKGPFGFILDTGGHDILTSAAAKAIGLKPEGAGISGGAGAGTVSEQYASVARVDIGGMTMRNQVFTIIPLSYGTVEQGARPPLAGILGLEIFERFAVRIDYRAKSLTLEPLATHVYVGRGTPVPIFFNDDEPILKATMDGHTGDFGIDTGNSGSLIVIGKWAEREGLITRLKSGLDVVGFGMGGMSHNWASPVDLDIGGSSLRRVIGRLSTDEKGAFASVVEAGNVGNDVLGHFTLDFDYRRRQLWFESVPGFEPAPFDRAGVGFSKIRPDAFKIVLVSQNSPAAEAGIKVGDEIVAVDGVPAQRLSAWDLRRRVRQEPGTRVKLDILGKRKAQSVVLTLRELLH